MNRFALGAACVLAGATAVAQPQLNFDLLDPPAGCVGCPDASVSITTDAAADSLQVALALEWSVFFVGDFDASLPSTASVAAATVLDPFVPIPAVNPFTETETSGLEINFSNGWLFASFEATDLGVETVPFMDLGLFNQNGYLDVEATLSVDGVAESEFSERFFPDTGLPCGFGDYGCDGDVDIIDFGAFADSFGSVTGDANYDIRSDAEPDGDVDIIDFGLFADNFGFFGVTPIPEPNACAIALLAGAMAATVRVR